MTEQKYVTVESNGIIIQIAKLTEIQGYTEGVLEVFFPDDDELNSWSKEQEEEWVEENNTRMTAICQFLNKHDY